MKPLVEEPPELQHTVRVRGSADPGHHLQRLYLMAHAQLKVTTARRPAAAQGLVDQMEQRRLHRLGDERRERFADQEAATRAQQLRRPVVDLEDAAGLVRHEAGGRCRVEQAGEVATLAVEGVALGDERVGLGRQLLARHVELFERGHELGQRGLGDVARNRIGLGQRCRQSRHPRLERVDLRVERTRHDTSVVETTRTAPWSSRRSTMRGVTCTRQRIR